MPKVVYVVPDGTAHEVEVPCGQSVMEGSLHHNLPGIVAECGGSCSCATCHVRLDDASAAVFEQASPEELELLEFTEGAGPGSRLACQLIVGDGCPAVRVVVMGTGS